MDLSTLQRVKERLGKSSTNSTDNGYSSDAQLQRMLTAVSQQVETYLDRTALVGSYTEELDLEQRQTELYLKAYPATAITSVKIDALGDWADADALDASSYRLVASRGLVLLYLDLQVFGPATCQVIYTGGMAASTAAFVSAFPAVAEAVDMQVAHQFSRKESMGSTSTNTGDHGRSFTGQYKLLDEVVARLAPYRRFAR